MSVEIILNLAWPTQTFLNNIVLLGKKAGGARCVSVCASLYRLLMAIIKTEVRKWDAEIASETDSAVAGKMPQTETAKRALFTEVKAKNGDTVFVVLWDVKKYFDSVQIPALIERASALNFPAVPLTLGLQMHRAPRLIRGTGTMAAPMLKLSFVSLSQCVCVFALIMDALADLDWRLTRRCGYVTYDC